MRKSPWIATSLIVVALMAAVGCNNNADLQAAGEAPEGYDTSGGTAGGTGSTATGEPGTPGSNSPIASNPAGASTTAPPSNTPDGTQVKTPPAQVQSGEVALRYKVAKGNSFNFTQTSSSEMRNPNANQGGPETVKITATQDMVVRITDVKNDVFDVEFTNKPPTVKAEPESARQLADMMGGNQNQDVVTTGTFSSLGQPGAVTGAGVLSGAGAINSAGFMGGGYSTTGVKQGESWNHTIDLSKMLPAIPGATVTNGEAKVTYTLKSLDQGAKTATIDVKFSGTPQLAFRVNARGSDGQTQQNEQKVTLNISMTGTVVINLEDGVAKKGDYTMKTSMQGGPALGNQTMTISLVRK